jgi:hypothetical protein
MMTLLALAWLADVEHSLINESIGQPCGAD